MGATRITRIFVVVGEQRNRHPIRFWFTTHFLSAVIPTLLAVVLPIIFAPPQTPVVETMLPNTATPGDRVDITGKNLDKVSEVLLSKGGRLFSVLPLRFKDVLLNVTLPNEILPDEYNILLKSDKDRLFATTRTLRVVSLPALPDLFICEVDVKRITIKVCNKGGPAVSANFTVGWSLGSYTGAGWQHLLVFRGRPFIATDGPLTLSLAGDLDVGAEFGVDIDNRITESDETNNCVNAKAELIPCRQSQ